MLPKHILILDYCLVVSMFLSNYLCLVLEIYFSSFFSHFLRLEVNLFLYVLYFSSLCLDLEFRHYLYSKFVFLHLFAICQYLNPRANIYYCFVAVVS